MKIGGPKRLHRLRLLQRTDCHRHLDRGNHRQGLLLLGSMGHNRPSTGCKKCRERHIRCDETKPACKRCLTRGHVCPGYRDHCGLIFKDVSRSVFDRQSRRATRDSLQRPHPALNKTSVPARLEIDPQTACICFFFRTYILTLDRNSSTSRGHFDHLVPLYCTAAPSSPLTLATSAMASRAMCLYYKQGQDSVWHTRSEMAASQAIRAAIADPVKSRRDDTLLAVLCLDYAEHLPGRAAGSKAASRAHVDGAIALIRHREPDSFSSSVSRSLLAATRANALLHTLWFGDQRSYDAVALLPDVEMGSDCNPAVALNQILARMLKLEKLALKQNWEETEAYKDRQRQHVLSRARDLDGQLLDWYRNLPTEWRLAVRIQTPLVDPSLTQEIDQGYPSSRVAYVIAQWHCTRLKILKLLYAATAADESNNGAPCQKASTLQNICEHAQETADGLCSVSEFVRGCGPWVEGRAVVERITKEPRVSCVGTPAESVYRGCAPGSHCPLVNVLSWALTTLTEKPQRAFQSFTIRPDTMRYLRDKHRMALGS